jgi:3-isopropylmalate/(R)-2-methylmalate dehydratase small subunit
MDGLYAGSTQTVPPRQAVKRIQRRLYRRAHRPAVDAGAANFITRAKFTSEVEIMPTRFKSSNALSDAELAKAAFADLDPGFSARALAGEYGIVVAGRNFGGGGKTIEGPVFTLRGAGIQVVIADSFARYFLRNAINNGFPILVWDGISAAVDTGQELEVNLQSSVIRNLSTGKELVATPLSGTALEILGARCSSTGCRRYGFTSGPARLGCSWRGGPGGSCGSRSGSPGQLAIAILALASGLPLL